MSQTIIQKTGERAEQKVFEALQQLKSPWKSFTNVAWRLLGDYGERVGEADVIVFHPNYGVIVIEVKAGAVYIKEGKWYYASGLLMDPFGQARRNRYALESKLKNLLSPSEMQTVQMTYAIWLPDIHWKGGLPSDAPSHSFILDRDSLAQPERALSCIFDEAFAKADCVWSEHQQKVLSSLLALDKTILVPLCVAVENTDHALLEATQQQVQVLRLLHTQKRLLIEGAAGTGKTVLGLTLAKEHALQGKKVLYTCFNRALAAHIGRLTENDNNIIAVNFHELVKQWVVKAGLEYQVPADDALKTAFFAEKSPELLMEAASLLEERFDTIVVDEAADFQMTWWVALEALGAPDFAWYCLYDLQQAIYQQETWVPPFSATPIILEENLRNTLPIGTQSAFLAKYEIPKKFRVQTGEPPVLLQSKTYDEMAAQLKKQLQQLLKEEQVRAEQIVILSPYTPNLQRSPWMKGLNGVTFTTDLGSTDVGNIRVSTIHSFKGLEADVVIVVGVTSLETISSKLIYVACSRAKAHLIVMALAEKEQ